MTCGPTAVDCIKTLLENHKRTLVEKRAFEEALLQLDVPDLRGRYNRAHSENSRTMSPAFQVVHRGALAGNWSEFYKTLRPVQKQHANRLLHALLTVHARWHVRRPRTVFPWEPMRHRATELSPVIETTNSPASQKL
jgi:hypothetical protein